MKTKCFIIVEESENFQGRKHHYNRQGVLTFSPAETKIFRYLTMWKKVIEDTWWSRPSYKHKNIDIFVNRRVLPKMNLAKRFLDVRETFFSHPFVFLKRDCADEARLIIDSYRLSSWGAAICVAQVELEDIEGFSGVFLDKVAPQTP